MTSKFHPLFWMANVFELFERFSFYGTKAILAVYLSQTIGLDALTTGSLIGYYSGLMWCLPPVAGVFVDRYGYKPTLSICFGMFAAGYFMMGMAGFSEGLGTVPFLMAIFTWTAVGGSLVKPCITGVIQRTTSDEGRSMGYSIYYALVNFGGGIGPIIAMMLRESWGMPWVMVVAGSVSALMCLSTLLFFSEPPGQEGQEKRSLGQTMREMTEVLKDVKFMTFLVIFSGFWIMFWQIFYSFPFYVIDVLKWDRFELLETIDAWTIIFVSVPIAFFVRKWSPIVAMATGFAIASGAWLVIASSTAVWAAVVTMVLFAIGEATQAPRYYEYVGSLAPKHQVGTYMGCSFIPVAIGCFVAGPLSGYLRMWYLEGPNPQPHMLWLTLAAIGFTSTALLLIYNAVVQVKVEPETATA